YPIILFFFFYCSTDHRDLHSFPTRRSSDLVSKDKPISLKFLESHSEDLVAVIPSDENEVVKLFYENNIKRANEILYKYKRILNRSEEHTSELQSRENLVCRLLLEKKKKKKT